MAEKLLSSGWPPGSFFSLISYPSAPKTFGHQPHWPSSRLGQDSSPQGLCTCCSTWLQCPASSLPLLFASLVPVPAPLCQTPHPLAQARPDLQPGCSQLSRVSKRCPSFPRQQHPCLFLLTQGSAHCQRRHGWNTRFSNEWTSE